MVIRVFTRSRLLGWASILAGAIVGWAVGVALVAAAIWLVVHLR